MLTTIILPIVATALLGFAVYRYKNSVAFTVTTISGDVPKVNPDIKQLAMWGGIQAEKLHIKNYGFRNLDNVELHLIMSSEPFSIEVQSPSSLSKNAIETFWKDKVLTIKLASLPASEEFKIDFVRVGHYDDIRDRLRGTGHAYRIVRLEHYRLWKELIVSICAVLFVGVLPSVLQTLVANS